MKMYQKRRKKRLSRCVKTIELQRSRNGYGFTISGERPCVLSCIASGSIAEKAGLRPGDFLLDVNGQDVSQALHDDVVSLVGRSTGSLTLQIAENMQNSDSSDEELLTRTKSKYQSKHRRPTQRAERVLNDLQSGAIFQDKIRYHHREKRRDGPTTPKLDQLRPCLQKPRFTEYVLPVMTIIVGYVGSVEIPSGSRQPLRNAVRRLRMEQHSFNYVLMQVLPYEVRLLDYLGVILATYPSDRLAYAGICPDDNRCFALITRVSHDSSSSCHVFTVDTALNWHAQHSSIAKKFGLRCTPDYETRNCLEFPPNAEAVLSVITDLYKKRCQSLFEMENQKLTRRNNSNASSGSDQARNQANVFVVDLEQRREAWKHEKQISSASSGSHRSEGPERASSPQAGSTHALDQQNSADNIRRRIHRYIPTACTENVSSSDADSIRSDPLKTDGTERLIPRSVLEPPGVMPPPLLPPRPMETERLAQISSKRRKSDGVFAGFKKPSTKPLRAIARCSDVNLKPSLSHESLAKAVNDEEALNRTMRLVPSSSMDSVADASARQPAYNAVQTAAASWALGLEKLLNDSLGLAVFMAFLKKEFSEENLVFWVACEQYKKLTSPDLRSFRAQEIFNKHMAIIASEPVNVDCQARTKTQEALANAETELFQIAQSQIFQLMKHDSYARFLKSDLYKECVVCEMEGRPLPYDPIEIQNENNSKTATLDRRKKNKEEEEGRRKSFFPWRARSKKPANKENDEQSNKKSLKTKEDSPKKSLSKESSSSSVGRKSENEVQSVEETRKDDELRERLETLGQVKVVLPDGTTQSTVVAAGTTVRMAIRKICERKKISCITIDVFQLGNDKVLDLDADITILGAKEIVLEKRTLFRLDFPNKKSIGVKAKPNRTTKDVLRPILLRYNYSLDNVHIYMNGAPVDLKGPVSVLENQRVVVQTQEDYEEWGRFDPGSAGKPPLPYNRARNYMNGSLDEITSRMLDDLIQPGASTRFDELGVLDKDAMKEEPRRVSDQRTPIFIFRPRNSLGDKEKAVKFPKSKPSAGAKSVTSKMNNIKITDPDGEYFLDLLSKAQSNRIDDQRGLSSDRFELPDFLKPENSPHVNGGSSSPYVIDNALDRLDSVSQSFRDDCVVPGLGEGDWRFHGSEYSPDEERTLIRMDDAGISMSLPPPLPKSEFEISISETPEANYPPPPLDLESHAELGITTSTPILPRAPPLPERRWRRNRPLDLDFVDPEDGDDNLPSPSTHFLVPPREFNDLGMEEVDVQVTFV